MMNIKLCGDLVLREICAPVEKIDSDLLKILDEMVVLMNAQDGVGLAAPQIGVTKRFIVMMNPDTKEIYKMINPEIVNKSSSTVSMEEGCLSILNNDNFPVFSNVTRPESITVKWMDEDGKTNQMEMSGMLSRIAQHELDHLDGVLFIDYLSSVKREMLMRKVKRK